MDADILNDVNNDMTKMWMTSYNALPMGSEDYMLDALDVSPVTFVIAISTQFMSYSGGR